MGGEEYRVALHYHCPEQEPITRLLSRIIVGTFFQWQLLKSPPWPLRLHLGLSRFCSEKAKKLLRTVCQRVAQKLLKTEKVIAQKFCKVARIFLLTACLILITIVL